MIKQILDSARVALIISALIALFWLGHHFIYGFVPESAWPAHISRWWDVMIGPLYVIFAGIANAVEEEEFKNIHSPSDGLFDDIAILLSVGLGLVLGITTGLMAGLIFLVSSMVFVLRLAWKLHAESRKKMYYSPTDEELKERWEESNWRSY